MRSEKILLGAAIVLSVFPVSAAIQHHRVSHFESANLQYGGPAAVGGGCVANGGPGCGTDGQSAPLIAGDEAVRTWAWQHTAGTSRSG
jgi:hypothetical protein